VSTTGNGRLRRRDKPFADRVRGADPSTPVPTCPEWNLGDLIRHVGGTHRELTADEMSCPPGRSDDSEVRVTLPVTPQGTSTGTHVILMILAAEGTSRESTATR
jgi:hypothetical protein